jgi:hypothetical protein
MLKRLHIITLFCIPSGNYGRTGETMVRAKRGKKGTTKHNKKKAKVHARKRKGNKIEMKKQNDTKAKKKKDHPGGQNRKITRNLKSAPNPKSTDVKVRNRKKEMFEIRGKDGCEPSQVDTDWTCYSKFLKKKKKRVSTTGLLAVVGLGTPCDIMRRKRETNSTVVSFSLVKTCFTAPEQKWLRK